MNKCCKELPQGYVLHDTIDLKNNKKQFWFVNIFATVVFLGMLVGGYFIVTPFQEENPWMELIVLGVFFVAYIAYIILHELTHGVFHGAFTKMKPRFGFVGWAAYCGNEAYCDKPRYVVVALAPVVFWGAVFALLNIFIHDTIWFWVGWMLQASNIGGAAGDFLVTYKMATYPKGILVQDTGVKMQVFRYDPAAWEEQQRAAAQKEAALEAALKAAIAAVAEPAEAPAEEVLAAADENTFAEPVIEESSAADEGERKHD